MSDAQERLCPEFEAYMDGMEQNMQLLVMRPTEKRIKIIIMAVRDAVDQLLAIFTRDHNVIDIVLYKMPQKIYGDYQDHVHGLLKKKCEKGVNFGRVKSKMNHHQIWGLFKGYWFHNAPKEMTKHLWVPLLRDIARYFAVEIGDKLGNNNFNNWSKWQVQEFVNLTFMKNIYEVKCQINQQSNPGGPVIQHACWKISSLQSLIHRKFDRSYGNRWRRWLEMPGIGGKKMRINSIIHQYVKPHAQEQWKNMLVLNDIKPELSEFSVNAQFIDQMNLTDYLRADGYENEDDDQSTIPSQPSIDNRSIVSDPNTIYSDSTRETNDNRVIPNPIITTPDNPPTPNNPTMSTDAEYPLERNGIPFTVNNAYGPSTGSNYNPSAARSHPYNPPSISTPTATSTQSIDINGRSSSYNPFRYYMQMNPYYYQYFMSQRYSPLMHQKCDKCRKCKHHCKCEDDDDSKNNEEVKINDEGINTNSNTDSVVVRHPNVISTMDNNYASFVPQPQLQPLQPLQPQSMTMQSQYPALFQPQLQPNASSNSFTSSSVNSSLPSVNSSNDESTQISNNNSNNNNDNGNNPNIIDSSLINSQTLSSFNNNNNGSDYTNYYQQHQYQYNQVNNNNLPIFPFINNANGNINSNNNNNSDIYGYNVNNNGNDNNDQNGMNIDVGSDNNDMNQFQNDDNNNFMHSMNNMNNDIAPNDFRFTNAPTPNGNIQNLNNLNENQYQVGFPQIQ